MWKDFLIVNKNFGILSNNVSIMQKFILKKNKISFNLIFRNNPNEILGEIDFF